MSRSTSPVPRLSDAQLVLLSAASQHDGNLVWLTDSPSSVSRSISALLRKGLLEEVIVSAQQPHWREDEDGARVGLKLSESGFAAIGVELTMQTEADPAVVASMPRSVKTGAKQALVVELLSRPGGATINDLIDATGWLPHTTRAALSGLRKRDFEVCSTKPAGAERRYSITNSPAVS